MDTAKTYKTIERYVTAIQYTGTEENIQALLAFTGDFYTSGLLNTNVGDWIVRKDDGISDYTQLEEDEGLEFEVLTNEEFQLNYRQSAIPVNRSTS